MFFRIPAPAIPLPEASETMLPTTGSAPEIAAFAAFRFFDIAKPWPVGYADRSLPGGFGVMADDILAGLYALLLLGGLWILLE